MVPTTSRGCLGDSMERAGVGTYRVCGVMIGLNATGRITDLSTCCKQKNGKCCNFNVNFFEENNKSVGEPFAEWKRTIHNHIRPIIIALDCSKFTVYYWTRRYHFKRKIQNVNVWRYFTSLMLCYLYPSLTFHHISHISKYLGFLCVTFQK